MESKEEGKSEQVAEGEQIPANSGQSVAADEVSRSLSEVRARVTELEQALAGKEMEITNLKQSKELLDAKVQGLDRSLAEAVAGYKNLVIKTNSDVLPELVSGETVQAIEESLKKAKALVTKVKQGIEDNLALGRFPTGAPERGGVGLDLSPREKIQQGISRRS